MSQSDKTNDALDVVWSQIKTFSMLIDNTQNLCDRCFELLKTIEQERTEARAAMFEQYIRSRIAEQNKTKKSGNLTDVTKGSKRKRATIHFAKSEGNSESVVTSGE